MIRSEILDSGLQRVTLARPEKANALTGAMLEELAGIFRASEAPVLVLTGEGRVFSAGADLAEAHAGLAVSPLWQEVSESLAAHPGLTIAALNGTLAGGATGIALACDLRIAVPGATFFYPVMRLGFRPPAPDPGRLVALVGPARAKLLLMGGARIDAAEALAWGLVDRVVADPLAEAELLSTDALAAAADHVTAIKRMCGPDT
ncbi:enoyl-CoA hydratase/isomerase family protein [Oceanicola sp. S124]|uniref:enoyl-CoA hydratase/isomerase family protein n=1 Tax=Oceanicola sp. S124 TaxID=1042378 RepID=UPI00025596CE|nr:enoyl-CoA hydratase/isomerase family protein [Oceanicola sp. S124]